MFTLVADRYVPPTQEVDPHGEVLRDKPAWGAPTPGQQDVVPLAERLQRKPTYKDPELTNKIWDLGVSAEDLLLESDPHRPDFSSLSAAELYGIVKEMRRDIQAAVSANAKPEEVVEKGRVYPQVPRPYIMDMVKKYILSKGDSEAAERFVVDTIDSRTRFYQTKHILNRMFQIMPPEDLYDYWYAITQAKILPLVNPEFVDPRYGSGVMGENIESLYKGWVENTPVFVDNPIPESVGWVSLIPEAPQEPWTVPEDIVPETPTPPAPGVVEPVTEPAVETKPGPKVSHRVKTIKSASEVANYIKVEAVLADKNDFDQFNLAVNAVMEENKPRAFFVNKFASEDGIITQCFIGPFSANTVRDLYIAMDLIKKDLSRFASFSISKA